MKLDELHELLERQFQKYNTLQFIENNPIKIPHQYSKSQDIEIAAFFAATFAWGLRKTIIKKSNELMGLFDNSPHDFIINHTEGDLKRLLNFKHRTFNATDLLYFIHFLKKHLSKHSTLEVLFVPQELDKNVKNGIINFYQTFVNDPFFPERTRKHVASPDRNSSCKRINMFLRWMVRKDENGVDFGLWKNIKSSQLVCPCDVHVDKVARELGLLTRKKIDWLSAEELTANLKMLDPVDPIKYDFALFGMGIDKSYQ